MIPRRAILVASRGGPSLVHQPLDQADVYLIIRDYMDLNQSREVLFTY
jgi:hypothetical protein